MFEIIYRMFLTVCVVSLSTRLFSFAIKKAGYSYLTANNLLGFMLHPLSLFILIVILSLMMLSIFFEVCSLLAAFQASERGERLKLRQLLLRGAKKLLGVVRHRNTRCILLTIFFVLAMGCFYYYMAAAKLKPIKDIMKNLEAIQWLFNGIRVVFVLLVLLLMRYVFVIPFSILDGRKTRDAAVKSRELFRQHPIFTSVSIISLCFLLYGVTRLTLYLGTLASAWVIGTFVDKSIQLAMVLTVFEWLQMCVVMLGMIVSVMLGMAYITAMYYEYRDELGMEPELLISFEDEQRQLLKTRKTSEILTAILVAIATVFIYDVVSNGVFYAKEVLVETKITAHRGSSADAPENTMPAFQLAMDQMADYVELDVQLSQDGEIIVLHDKSFKRTTGVNLSPWNLTYDAILGLDAGSYKGAEYIGTPVPTLAEVFELCQGMVMINIELKNNGHDETLVQDVVALIEEYHFENQCVLTSTSLGFLKEAKELNPELQTGYILSTAYGSFYNNDAVDFFSVSSGLLTESIVESIHESGHAVHAWTVNSKTEMERMKLLGVDNIITDYPVLAREILYRKEDTEGIMEYVSLMLNKQ